MITKISKLLLILVIAVSMACTVDRIYTSRFTIVNESSHDIEIEWVFASFDLPQKTVLKVSESITYIDGYEASEPPIPTIHIVDIIYDGNIKTTYTEPSFHSICDYRNYQYSKTGKYEGTFTFTFTDEDYEYALSQQTE
ncbi:MAG: hypothetical protein J6K28_01345 [Alistipes sp.]|nr:hypothetical protein [Alistipes sp.]